MVRELIALENNSKVWVYPSDRELSYDELDSVREQLFDFLDVWTAHNQNLMTYGNVFHRRFLALFVDETYSVASGCSIDKSVNFLEGLRRQHGLNFFERMQFQYMVEEEIYQIQKSELKEAYLDGRITDDTLFFDHLVNTKEDFLKSWLKPFSESWHYKFV